MSQKDRIRTNNDIRVPRVRLIDPDGRQIGVVETKEALRIAQDEYGLDLVEISPTAVPPVCKIMDAGKYKYQLKKKAQEAKKHQSVIQVKEVKFRPRTDTHDVEFKTKHVLRFLKEGHKTKLTIFFKGREMAYKEQGLQMLARVYKMFEDIAVIEQEPRAEGRYLTMVIAPKREWLEAVRREKEKAKEQVDGKKDKKGSSEEQSAGKGEA